VADRLVTIRLRGDYLAIATFGVAVSIQLVTLTGSPLTGGAQGLTRIGSRCRSVPDAVRLQPLVLA